jgi:hypothetical protein
MTTGGDQLRMQDRLDDVLQPGTLTHDLIAAGICRRRACVTSSAIHTSGRKPLA